MDNNPSSPLHPEDDIPLESSTISPEFEVLPEKHVASGSGQWNFPIRRTLWFFGALLLCFLVVPHARQYALKAWGSLRLVNTVVNLTPTFLAILFAFVVDKDLADRMRWRWLFRSFVICCGIGLSLLLWHQQSLADIQSQNQIQTAVNQAVDKANAHSDEQFGKVQTKVGTLDTKVDGLGTQIGNTKDSISESLNKATGDLNTSLGKVGKPDPPELAKLQFSFVSLDATTEPIETLAVQQAPDGTISFPFIVRNISNVQAEGVDIWVNICKVCTYAEEPADFEHVKGAREWERHRVIPAINAGVGFGIMTIKLKAPLGFPSIGTSFVGSCKNCGPLMRTKDYLLLVSPLTPTQQNP
jgi:hypothetical protein